MLEFSISVPDEVPRNDRRHREAGESSEDSSRVDRHALSLLPELLPIRDQPPVGSLPCQAEHQRSQRRKTQKVRLVESAHRRNLRRIRGQGRSLAKSVDVNRPKLLTSLRC